MKMEDIVIGSLYQTNEGDYAIVMQVKNSFWYGPLFSSTWKFKEMRLVTKGNGGGLGYLVSMDFNALSEGRSSNDFPYSIEILMGKFGCQEPQTRQLVQAILAEVKKEAKS